MIQPKDIVACSLCFHDIGLHLMAEAIGIKNNLTCPLCGATKGKKLNLKQIHQISDIFFIYGSYLKSELGGANYLQTYEGTDRETDMITTKELSHDIDLLRKNFCIRVNYYGPRLYRLGYTTWTDRLKSRSRKQAIDEIFSRARKTVITDKYRFYRIRTNINGNILSPKSYDSSPTQRLSSGRLNIKGIAVFYASFNIETSIHEARVTIDDQIYLATFRPKTGLRVLDLSIIKDSPKEENEFEYLKLELMILFAAGKPTYKMTQAFSKRANELGFDGIIYPSYFNQVRTKQYKNLILFGSPVKDNKVEIISIDKILLDNVKYKYIFGPVTRST